MQANQETIKLMELLEENLVEGNFEVLRNIAESGIHPTVRDKILTITKLFQQTTLQSNIHEIDVFFYRDFLKEVMNGQITEANINNRLDIARQKKEEVLQLLRRIRSSEQSRISAQSELKTRKKQYEQLRSQSLIADQYEKRYSEKQKKLTTTIKMYQEQIESLKSKIKNQAQIIDDYIALQEERQKQIIKRQQQIDKSKEEISQLKEEIRQVSRLKEEAKEASKLKQEITKLKEKEKEKDKEIFKLKYQISEFKEEIQQSANQSRILNSQVGEKEHIIQNYQSIISSQQQQGSKLKQELELLRVQIQQAKMSKPMKRRSTKELFIDSNSLVQKFQMDDDSADSFHQILMKRIGQVTSMNSLYNFSLHKGENFHKRVDNKKNILLLCLTKDNRIVGGYTSSGFSLLGGDKNENAFLFSFYLGKMKTFGLKKGKKSTLYDTDFIIFGNEQLCIEKGSDLLTSYFVNGSKNALSYQYDNQEDKEKFLSLDNDGKTSVELLNYEFIELKIKSD